MALTFTIGGVDRTSVVRGEDWVLVEQAERASVGIGGLTIDDTATITINPWAEVEVSESLATPNRMFTGYTAERSISRGTEAVGNDRTWDVTLVDKNACLDFIALDADQANRPAETDRARVNWVRSRPAVTSHGILNDQTYQSQPNPVNLDATDHQLSYPRGVVEECGQASGNNFFVYSPGSNSYLAYFDSEAAILDAQLRISTLNTDYNPTGSPPTFPPSNLRYRLDPSNLYSRAHFKWSGGIVHRSQSGTSTFEAQYGRHDVVIVDNGVKTIDKARNKADRYLLAARQEKVTLEQVQIILPAANVNDIRAGHRVQVKASHLGIGSFTYFRVTRREIRPLIPGSGSVLEPTQPQYIVNLTVAERVKPTTFYTNPNRPKGGR